MTKVLLQGQNPKLLPIANGGTGATNVNDARLALDIPVSTYEYSTKDLSQFFTATELHEKIVAGDFSGIRIGDYWPIVLNGTYHDYAEDVDKTFVNAIVNLEFMLNFYKGYGDVKISNHILVCSRDCLPIALQMRSADETWYDETATNPFLGSHLYQTFNASDGIIALVEQTELGQYIGNMRFVMEVKIAGDTAARSQAFGDRGKLFLPYEREVWGQDIWSEHGYGGGGNAMQWPIFVGSRQHIIKSLGNGGSICAWWCASSLANSTTNFCRINGDGATRNDTASTARGVPLCFIIK